MNSTAVNFEYEWMEDGTLRLRFINDENAILGQQLVASDGLVSLQLLITLAVVKHRDIDVDELLDVLRGSGIDADFETAAFLKEADRVRAGITPEGDFGVEVVDDD